MCVVMTMFIVYENEWMRKVLDEKILRECLSLVVHWLCSDDLVVA